MLDYECPSCGFEMRGDFGKNVYCPACDKTYETDSDTNDDESFSCWLTGKFVSGKALNYEFP